MSNRTEKGNVTAESRKEHGDKEGRFPIFDRRSANSALKLRGHNTSKAQRRAIIRRAAKFLPAAAKAAWQSDKEKGLI